LNSDFACDRASTLYVPPRSSCVWVQQYAQDAVDAEPGAPEAYDRTRFLGWPKQRGRCDVCEVLIADTVMEGISSEVTGREALQMHI
jgi:hypothetical protein